ncbi:MAG: hypothetical protein DCC75_01430 [Proteobacteria bacterium]|nr:MAG: hypothetical protein DCC75_01430 [Pseudomonadota bacterium]
MEKKTRHFGFYIALILCFSWALFFMGCNEGQDGSAGESSVVIRIVHPPELNQYLSSLRESFYLSNPRIPGDIPVRLDFVSEAGPSAARRIANGELKTDSWITSSQSLLNLTNKKRVNLGPEQVDCITLFETPLVVTVNKQYQHLLGAEGGKVKWSKLMYNPNTDQAIVSEAPFRLALSHTQPNTSSTGFSSLVLLAHLAGLSSGQPLDVKTTLDLSNNLREILKRYESMVFAYPLGEEDLIYKAANSNSARVRMGFTTEQQLFQYSQRRKENDAEMSALLPEEGTIWQEFTFCNSKADWVTPAKHAGIKLLRETLTSPEAKIGAERLGYRVSDISAADRLAAGSKAAARPLAEVPRLGHLEGEMVSLMLKEWPNLRKPSALVFVLDASGSMEGDALSTARENFRRLLAVGSQRDIRALVTFSTNPKIEGDFSSNVQMLTRKLDQLQAVGGSAVYDGIKTALDLIARSEARAFRKLVLVLTDGDDKNSEISISSLLGIINRAKAERDFELQILAIKREGSDFSDLERIAQAADGKVRTLSMFEMDQVFQEISRGL